MKLRNLAAAAAMSVVAGLAASAHAASYVWTFSDATYSASGTLTTDPTNTYAISGGGTVTGPSLSDTLTLVPNPTPGSVSISSDGEWGFDNAVPLTFNGILFSGAINPFYDLFANGGGASIGISLADGSIYNKGNDIIGVASITPVGGTVPEPATWVVMLVGFGGLGAVLRSRRKLSAAAA